MTEFESNLRYILGAQIGIRAEAAAQQHELDRYQAWRDGRLPTIDPPAQPIMTGDWGSGL